MLETPFFFSFQIQLQAESDVAVAHVESVALPLLSSLEELELALEGVVLPVTSNSLSNSQYCEHRHLFQS